MRLMLKKPKSSEMCPPGFHVVRGHNRICHSGTKTWVDGHLRKNPGKKLQLLLFENLHHLFWNSQKVFNTLNGIKGFNKYSDLDEVIQFWLEYWEDQGLEIPGDLDPLLIKTIIAIESNFDPTAKSKVKGSSATGLMQITDQARRILAGIPDSDGYREMRSDYLRVDKKEIEDPLINIAAGTRWFLHKYSTIPRKAGRSVHNAIKNYYGWNKDGEKYAQKVENLYEKSK